MTHGSSALIECNFFGGASGGWLVHTSNRTDEDSRKQKPNEQTWRGRKKKKNNTWENMHQNYEQIWSKQTLQKPFFFLDSFLPPPNYIL